MLLEKLLELLDLHVPVALTEGYAKSVEDLAQPKMVLTAQRPEGVVFDGRQRIQPKYKGESLLAEYGCQQAYYQVFVNQKPGQAGFIPNLSILDLLSAEGPDAGRFLRT